MGETSAALLVEVGPGLGYGDEELARLTGRLRTELLNLDVHAVQYASAGPPPEGAKGLPSVAADGGLVVRFIGRDVLEAVIGGIRSWLSRQRCHSIKITLDGDSLELVNPSSAEHEQLVSLWISRHVG
jgi:hypothetical protein